MYVLRIDNVSIASDNGSAPDMTQSPGLYALAKWKHFRVAGPLCGEFTGRRWTPLTKASDAELWCFLWSAPQ